MVWGAVIAGVASVASAALSKSSGGKRISPKQIRREALAGGFNPLTVLRASAGGGLGVEPRSFPQLSSASVIAQALGGIGQAYFDQDPVADQTAQLENDLLRIQIEAAREASRRNQRQPLVRRGVQTVPTSPGRRSVTSFGAEPTKNTSGGFQLVEGIPAVLIDPGGNHPQPVRMGDKPMDVESAETGYGEGGEFLVGAWNGWNYFQSRILSPWLARRQADKDQNLHLFDGNAADRRAWLRRQLARPAKKTPRTYFGRSLDWFFDPFTRELDGSPVTPF